MEKMIKIDTSEYIYTHKLSDIISALEKEGMKVIYPANALKGSCDCSCTEAKPELPREIDDIDIFDNELMADTINQIIKCIALLTKKVEG